MQRASWRTLVLLIELLVAVASVQYLGTIRPARASAIWLAGTGAAESPTPSPDVNDALST